MYLTRESASRYLFELRLNEMEAEAKAVVNAMADDAVARLGPAKPLWGKSKVSDPGYLFAQGQLNQRYSSLLSGLASLRALSQEEIAARQQADLMRAMNVYGQQRFCRGGAGGALLQSLGMAGVYPGPPLTRLWRKLTGTDR